LVEVCKFCHRKEPKANQAEIFNVRITFANIIDKVPNTYNTNEGWVVKKMKSKYANKFVAILPIIY
jgi:hypothetical protein